MYTKFQLDKAVDVAVNAVNDHWEKWLIYDGSFLDINTIKGLALDEATQALNDWRKSPKGRETSSGERAVLLSHHEKGE